MNIELFDLNWIESREYPNLFNGMVKGEVFAWIQKRPLYCNRGHWQANIALPMDLDDQDGFPRYYMKLKTAKREIKLFLLWRINKIRAE